MADQTMDQLVANVAELSRAVDKLSNNIFGGSARTRKQMQREKPNTEKLALQGVDPVKQAAQDLRTEKALKDLKKSLDDSFKKTETYGNDMRVAGAAFQNAVKGISLKQFDELPKKISELTKSAGIEFKSIGDINKALMKYSEENIDAAKHYQEEMFRLTAGTKEYEKCLTEINKLGYENIAELTKSKEELMALGTVVGKAVNAQTQAIDKNAASTADWTKWIKVATAATIGFANKIVDTLIVADKYNTSIKTTGIGMTALGMSAESFAKLQNENIQSLNANGESLSDFNSYLIGASASMLTYTGDMETGARLAAQNRAQAVLLTNDTKQQAQSIAASNDVFKDMYGVMGTTADSFNELNKSLMANSDIQTTMYRLDQARRIQTMAEIQQTVLYLGTQRLEQKEAESLIATFQKMNNQGPKDRIKQAAQIMAAGGAMGMGPESRELAMIVMRGAKGKGDIERQAELESQIQKKSQAQAVNATNSTLAGNMGPELVRSALIGISGATSTVFGDQGPQAALGTRTAMSNKEVLAAENRTADGVRESNGFLDLINKAVVGTNGILKGLFGSGLVGTITAVYAFFKAKNLFQWAVEKFAARGATGAATSVAEGAVGAAEGGAATAAGGGVLAAAALPAAIVAAVTAGFTGLYAITKAAKGEDASNWISNLDAKLPGGGLGGWLSQVDDPVGMNRTYRNYNKDSQVESMMSQYDTDIDKGDQKGADELYAKMDELVTAMAKADGRDPALAVERLHKTIKEQHQENKNLTEEQTDAIKGQTDQKLVKVSNRNGISSVA